MNNMIKLLQDSVKDTTNSVTIHLESGSILKPQPGSSISFDESTRLIQLTLLSHMLNDGTQSQSPLAFLKASAIEYIEIS